MARSKGRTRSSKSNFLQPSAKPLTFAKPIRLPRLTQLPSVTLKTIEDRRTHYPDPYTRPAASLPRSASRLVVSPNVNKPYVKTKPTHPGAIPTGVSFAVPDRVAICVRRNRRKEVLHALKRVGKGSGRSKRRKSRFSGVSC